MSKDTKPLASLTMILGEEHARTFLDGINLFNQRQFLKAHELLEEIWRDYPDIKQEREILQGLIQIAVGYHHALNQNFIGASKLLERGLSRLTKYPSTNLSLDLASFCTKVDKTINNLRKDTHTNQYELDIPTLCFL